MATVLPPPLTNGMHVKLVLASAVSTLLDSIVTVDELGENNNNKGDINLNIFNNTCCSTDSTCSCTCSSAVGMELDAIVSTLISA
eukprot:5822620-Prymnesium_polylepis.1